MWATEDDDYGDLRISAASLAVDAGNNAAVPAGITTDLDGNARFVDVPTADDVGSGTAPIVDIGAYERQHLVGDVNGDWVVDVIDLLWLIDTFGKAAGDPGYNSACDFNHDGTVDVIDLLDMIGNFGK